jgi:hypothetical protein
MFCAAVVLKFVPVMVTLLPIAPVAGVKEVMDDAAPITLVDPNKRI